MYFGFSIYVSSELKGEDGWTKHHYAREFSLDRGLVGDNVERVDSRRMTKEQFIELYEKRSRPVVLLGLQDEWEATKKWKPEVCYVQEIHISFCSFHSSVHSREYLFIPTYIRTYVHTYLHIRMLCVLTYFFILLLS